LNQVAFLLSVYGAAIYIVVGLMTFCSVTSSWTNPWPGDKALALAAFWPAWLVLFLGKSLITGVIKLAKDFIK